MLRDAPDVKHLLSSVFCALLLSACSDNADVLAPKAVMAITVGRGGEAETRSYPAQVAPRYSAAASFDVPGKITATYVETGSLVRAGQPLARIDPGASMYDADSAASAERVAAGAQQQQATDMERARKLLAEGFISQAEFDRQELSFAQAQAQLRTARNTRSAASRQAAHHILRASRDGIVTSLTAQIGQVVQPGQSVAVIADPATKEAVFAVPEIDVARLRSADISVGLASRLDRIIPGRLRAIDPAADPRTRLFVAHVTFDAGPNEAPIGGSLRIITRMSGGAQATSVPATAITQFRGKTIVWLLAGSPARVQPKTVRLAGLRGEQAIIASGLKAGDNIVVAGAHLLRPGQIVRPIMQETSDRL
ncbi:efflux RND transporter periplasmic adaptor subunit [Sphingomonas crocodyli]|uniref:Efflux RND transporter periplasmic adaptor subunit n=1 Tax=Sphingomonas crocodyli TaxID=1979270 RepID=A0A437LXM1_9SPHN|nr:efflux RND transporter periplasmic adaptor subunit [Sphingomonas crocodyli]RVT90149.1 efflux RND transporter periplasmic adaptor subunit [Sphingomonas crocodyli]